MDEWTAEKRLEEIAHIARRLCEQLPGGEWRHSAIAIYHLATSPGEMLTANEKEIQRAKGDKPSEPG